MIFQFYYVSSKIHDFVNFLRNGAVSYNGTCVINTVHLSQLRRVTTKRTVDGCSLSL